MNSDTVKSSVRDQFNRFAHHYNEDSPMANRELLSLIVRLAEPRPDDQTLDVACGAGHLVREFAVHVRRAVGVDLSPGMLSSAERSSLALGLTNTGFSLADVEAVPFVGETFDIVTCKLALHYFPDPIGAIREMERLAKTGARIVLIDRIASEDRAKQEYQNRIEILRTPSKTKIYSCSEIVALLGKGGLRVESVHHFEQHQDFAEWIDTTGASEENRQRAEELLLASVEGDLAGFKVRLEGERIRITHSTAIIVARKAAGTPSRCRTI